MIIQMSLSLVGMYSMIDKGNENVLGPDSVYKATPFAKDIK